MLQLALLVPCHTWARRVRDIMSDPRLPSPIPDIFDANIVTDAEERLVFMDSAAFLKDARKELPDLGASYDSLGCFSKVAIGLLLVPWRWVRIWYLIKLAGVWPVGLFDVETKIGELPSCWLCGCPNIQTCHVLGECTKGRRRPTSAPTVSDLFREPCHRADFLQHVPFVGSQVEAQIRWHLFGHSPEQDEVRVDTWTMDFQRGRHEQ